MNAPSARVVLHGNWRSSSSQRVACALHLKGIAYDYRAVNLDAREQEGEAFRAVHAGGQVPVLVVGESGADGAADHAAQRSHPCHQMEIHLALCSQDAPERHHRLAGDRDIRATKPRQQHNACVTRRMNDALCPNLDRFNQAHASSKYSGSARLVLASRVREPYGILQPLHAHMRVDLRRRKALVP